MNLAVRAAVLALAALAAVAGGAEEPAPPVRTLTVFAAASLTDVMREIGAAFREDGGIALRWSFAASSVLARQIEAGAPADVFVSADREWMDYLEARARIAAATRRDVAGNALALIAPRDGGVSLAIGPGFPVAEALGGGRLATGNPDTVPAGRYARAALESLGVWADVAGRLVPADNVRAALAYVSRGEAPLGIVYRTDARVDPAVRVVGEFPADSHPPIVYPAAATRATPAAAAFLDYLLGRRARAIFARHGFTDPPAAAPAPPPAGGAGAGRGVPGRR